MTREEIDIMWQQALKDSVRDGEIFTRYHFAKLVAAKEREACAKFIEDGYVRQFENPWREDLAAAIRARGEA